MPPLPAELRAAADAVRWTPERTSRLIRGMPKVETHLHLDGALSPATIKELAVRQDYAPLASKTVAEIAALSIVGGPMASLAEVLRKFGVVYPLLRTRDAVETCAHEAARAAARENVRYAEFRFAPALQSAAGFSPRQVLDAALAGLARGKDDFGVDSGVIVCLIRPFAFVDRGRNEEMLELAVAYKDRGVVGLDLAGDEAAQPLSDFADYFARAKTAGLRLTAHAGEAPGSSDLETALSLGVDRLGHATLLAGNPELLAEVRRRGLTIEVNLTSNVRTSAVKSAAAHPVKDWYAAGVPIALSTDDPGSFGIGLSHEYELLSRELGFGAVEILDASFQAVDALFLPETRKRALRASFEAETLALLPSVGA